MRLVFITLLALIIASGIGLGSTWMTATKSAADDSKQAKPAAASSALAFPQNYAAEDNANSSTPRKN